MLSYIFGKLMNVMGLAVAPNVSEKNGKEKNELSDLNIQLKHRYMIWNLQYVPWRRPISN